MFIQLQSVFLYILVVICISPDKVSEIAITSLRSNTIANSFFLFVFYFISRILGTTVFELNTMLIVGLLFLFVDFCFKLAVFLFHY